MTEEKSIAHAPVPRTRKSLTEDLRRAGLEAGVTVLVHSSLSSLGWVCGGALSVIEALTDTLGPGGTLVVPTFTNDNSEPSLWSDPPVPEEWWPVVREHSPAYDPARTPTRRMGRIPELFRTWPGVLRSRHPATSFAARGPQAPRVTENHEFDFPLGEGSPLARIYDLDGFVLLLGVGHDNNSSLHLAETRAPGGKIIEAASARSENGRRVWQSHRDIESDLECFRDLGGEYDAAEGVTPVSIGSASCRLFRQRSLVDFAVPWIARYREVSKDG